MSIAIRPATEADAKHVAALLIELGYPSAEADVRNRLRDSPTADTTCVLVAQAEGDVVGLMCAQLVPYFPRGSTVCRVTALVVSADRRSQGVGEQLLAGADEFARKHRCAGIEITSAENRLDAHRFYQRLGFARTSFRFFKGVP
jgi:predicted N-acetyltransferase YhbS